MKAPKHRKDAGIAGDPVVAVVGDATRWLFHPMLFLGQNPLPEQVRFDKQCLISPDARPSTPAYYLSTLPDRNENPEDAGCSIWTDTSSATSIDDHHAQSEN